MKIRLPAVLWIVLTVCLPASASEKKAQGIPSSLEPWKAWVLHGEEHRLCPTSYNNGTEYRCLWPSRLQLDLQSSGGRFEQQWLVLTSGWVSLPGGRETWPEKVTANGRRVSVSDRNGSPYVYLEPGEYTVSGRFQWERLPEMIHVPPTAGLVSLSIDGRSIPFPPQESDGRLWLKRKQTVEAREDRVEARLFRLVDDDIPMKITTLVRVNISGQPREVSLEGAVPDGFVPMSIATPIPARIGFKGNLVIQGRPGRWEIRVMARSEKPVHGLGPIKAPLGPEVWALQSRNHLRMVKVEGVPSIDPNQTDSPQEWRTLPTFLVDRERRITFKEIRRGDPDPAPDRLSLERTWWLDFDGAGFTVRDHITGTMSRQWYLAVNPPVELGRVTLDGRDQLITAQGKEKRPGVELRRGQLDLTAESRIEKTKGTLPAVGWNHDFQSVRGVLHLPPGWRLLTVSGVDTMPGAWFERWTLLDLFIVLIIALAVARLWGWPWGFLALAAVALTYHEPGAPRLVWLSLVAAYALFKFLPEGWGRRLANLWRIGTLVALAAIALPFMVQQVRWGVYPQLEPRYSSYGYGTGLSGRRDSFSPRVSSMKESLGRSSKLRIMEKDGDYEVNQALQAVDPEAVKQTGPGVPSWTWRSFAMGWNGPVEKDQRIRFRLLSPRVNLGFAFARVILLFILMVKLVDPKGWKPVFRTFSFVLLLLAQITLHARLEAQAATGSFPPPELLGELKTRLLEKPDCLPSCAQSPRMELTADADALRILFEVHAAAETAVPLPGSAGFWLPQTVLMDSMPAKGLSRDKEGSLWILVPRGIHMATLSGPIPPGADFQIPMPLRPHRVTVSAEGWEVRGVGQNGQAQASIKFIRKKRQDNENRKESVRAALPSFFHVERILSLGLEWQVRSRITRLTPTGTPAIVSVPLIPGESVTSSGAQVRDGMVHIQMAPKTREAVWESTLEKKSVLTLEAPSLAPWAETWTLESNPIWHCEPSGIPVVHHQDASGYWRPQWKPWPGEEVTIRISRPEAVPGQVVTIDSASLTFAPGLRFSKAALNVNIRTSRGGQHKILLPEGAKLQMVKLLGKEQPIREQGREVILPLQPGPQAIELEWRRNAGSSFLIKAPRVVVGERAVNADVTFQMPGNRWILWTVGPALGPAVLFWSYLAVIVLAALALGRVSWTPLKTRHWLLLGLGLTQVPSLLAILIVGWFLAMGLRGKRRHPHGRFTFNIGQILLLFWTAAALVGLYFAIQQGLLGIPNMQIAGNGSSAFRLHWTQDRIGPVMPQPAVFSLNLLVFRFLMLSWALWLAYSLLKWLRWGWDCFNEGGAWQKMRRRITDETHHAVFDEGQESGA